jgi:hypothetical protein
VALLLVLLALPLALTLIVPRAWLPPYVLAITGGCLLLWADEARQCASCGGVGAGLGMAMFMALCVGFGVAICLRLGYAALRPSKAPAAAGMSALSASTTWAMLAVAGAGLATALMITATSAVFDSGLATHVAVALLAVGWFFLSGPWTSAPVAVKYAGVLTIAVAFVWSLAMAPRVVEAAALAAKGEPYCIQVAGPSGLRPARGKFDLTGFMMRAGHASARHANLAVGVSRSPKWMYWSYGRGAFEPELMGGVLRCELLSAGEQTLGWVGSATAQVQGTAFWLAGGRWKIPAEFRGEGSDRPAALQFYAEGRTFEPLARPPQGAATADWDVIRRQVKVSLCAPEALHAWHVVRSDVNFQLETTGIEHGLERQVVTSRGARDPRIQFVGRDGSGDASTWIRCDGPECRHAFKREGIVVEFMHPASELAAWPAVEDAAWRRIRSFALEWPRGTAPSCSDNRA